MKEGLFEIKLNNKKIEVAIADTVESRQKGLSGLEKMNQNKGLLFMFTKPTRMKMVMRDMKFPLDFIFIDENWEIVQISSLDNKSGQSVTPTVPVTMVLEVNKGFASKHNIMVGLTIEPSKKLLVQQKGVKKFQHGGKFEKVGDVVYEVKEDDIKVEDGRLQILDKDGVVVGNIDSGSRILSRGDTKNLLKSFKKGDKIQLADLLIDILDKHEKQKPDYVTR